MGLAHLQPQAQFLENNYKAIKHKIHPVTSKSLKQHITCNGRKKPKNLVSTISLNIHLWLQFLQKLNFSGSQ